MQLLMVSRSCQTQVPVLLTPLHTFPCTFTQDRSKLQFDLSLTFNILVSFQTGLRRQKGDEVSWNLSEAL